MATGSVSALDQDTWQLVQTNTTTSGSTSTFSGLSGYKKYILTFEGVTLSSDVITTLTFNSSTSNYFGRISLWGEPNYQGGAGNGIPLNYSNRRTSMNGLFVIDNVTNGAPRTVQGTYNTANAEGTAPLYVDGGWLDLAAITSIVLTPSSGTFTAGSMKLYGIAG